MKIGAFQLNKRLPELNEPHVFAMLKPWIDAGSVGELTLGWLETRFKAKELAYLARPGDFFDFTRYRPSVYSKNGQRQMAIPNAYITWSRQKTGNDFIFMHLMEPHSHGEVFVDSILELMEKLKVKRYCLLGSMYDLVPHTRPLAVSGSAYGKEAEHALKKIGIELSNYQGPGSICSLISIRGIEIGYEAMSLLVHLPQYTELDEDYIGTVRLMEVLGLLYNFSPDESYIEKARQQQEQINQAIEKNPQLRAIVEQLESHYEKHARKPKVEETPRLSPEIEKFLIEMEKRFKNS